MSKTRRTRALLSSLDIDCPSLCRTAARREPGRRSSAEQLGRYVDEPLLCTQLGAGGQLPSREQNTLILARIKARPLQRAVWRHRQRCVGQTQAAFFAESQRKLLPSQAVG